MQNNVLLKLFEVQDKKGGGGGQNWVLDHTVTALPYYMYKETARGSSECLQIDHLTYTYF